MLMAAEVSSLMRVLNKGESRDMLEEGGRGLVTRDLLGGCKEVENKELDLDLKVPMGWEKRLDLLSGEVFFHRSPTTTRAPPPPSSPPTTHQDLNFTPLSKHPQPNLDFKLFPPPLSSYQSVCTLDKVKSALHRIELATTVATHKPKTLSRPSPSTSTSTTTASSATTSSGESPVVAGEPAMVAAGCPSCLSYVLVPEGDGRCPRCHAAVEVAGGRKRRRVGGVDIDLNLNIGCAGGV